MRGVGEQKVLGLEVTLRRRRERGGKQHYEMGRPERAVSPTGPRQIQTPRGMQHPRWMNIGSEASPLASLQACDPHVRTSRFRAHFDRVQLHQPPHGSKAGSAQDKCQAWGHDHVPRTHACTQRTTMGPPPRMDNVRSRGSC